MLYGLVVIKKMSTYFDNNFRVFHLFLEFIIDETIHSQLQEFFIANLKVHF